MTTPDPEPPPERTDDQVRLNRMDRRRERIAAEIRRNRQGDYRVPTWVLVVVLVLLLGGWIALIVLS